MRLSRRSGLAITTPPTSPVGCQSTLVNWQGGQAPYILDVYSPNAQGRRIQSFPAIPGLQLAIFFLPGVTDTMVMAIQDATGANDTTDAFQLIPPSQSRTLSCLIGTEQPPIPEPSTINSVAPTDTVTPAAPSVSIALNPGPTSSASHKASSMSNTEKVGLIVGITITSVAILAVLVILLYIVKRRRQRAVSRTPQSSPFDDVYVDARHGGLGRYGGVIDRGDTVREVALSQGRGNTTRNDIGRGRAEMRLTPFPMAAVAAPTSGKQASANRTNVSSTGQLSSTNPNSPRPSHSETVSISPVAFNRPHAALDSGIRFGHSASDRSESRSNSSEPAPGSLPPAYIQPLNVMLNVQ
ncbi:hypothetical protein PHLCEN_2v2321 [Hermanssonia centrifuga]|uniref:Mid2 domain-containing protein n=1 Tax=Hermanssonia centrifuga TaxID=98765 RepID=A0A2R6RPF9_9APHY|nr:hypothetical protein PHLCEN_2v2321 [Hermanssonia centrifuga]